MRLLGLAVLGLHAVLGGLGLFYQFQEPTVGGFTLFIAWLLLPSYLFFKLIYEEARAGAFVRFLHANKDKLLEGSLRYGNCPVTMETVLRRYSFTISLIIVSMKTPTRFYIDGCHFTSLHSLANSLISFVFGWWGFPWGIPYTIQSIVKNIKGGDVIKIRDLIAPVPKIPELIR